jgi:hypothetical protein
VADLPFIHAHADGLDQALVAQAFQRLPGAVHGLFEHLGLFIATGEDVDVMDETDVHALQRHALQAVLERAHHPVVGIVEMHREGRGIGPGGEVDLAAPGGFQNPAHLGGQDEIIAVLPA